MKKFLSLVLALVMTMSLVTISAGAKDYTDASEITYKEAVDVMSELKVIDGYTDGSFNPDATLTRGAAAKIICNLILGPTTAAALKADSAVFPDVPANHTFAGYIAYCAQQGIIAGYADGTFKPANGLTGYAFMKMLLGALGYDQNTEGYVGPNYSIQVAKQALAIGLDDGNANFDGTKIVTREEALLYAFNTLKANMVEYTAKTEVSTGNAVVTISGGRKDVANTKFDYAGREGEDGDTAMQFVEKYFNKVTLEKDFNEFGQPINVWANGKKDIGSYVKAADAHYEADVNSKTVYADVDLDDDYKFDTIVDGDENVLEDAFELYKKGEEGKVKLSKKVDGLVGNGSDVYVYVDDARVVVINTFLAIVGDDYDDKKEELEIDAIDGIRYADDWDGETLLADDWSDLDEYAEEDYVLITLANGEIASIEKAEPVKATVTEYVHGESVTAGGEEYKYSVASEALLDSGDEKDEYYVEYNLKKEYALYLDEEGNVLFAKGEKATAKYLYIDEFSSHSNSTRAAADAYAFFTDGTEAEIKVSKIGHEDDEKLTKVTAADVTDENTLKGYSTGWFKYTVKDEKYELTYVGQTGENVVADEAYVVNYKKNHTEIDYGTGIADGNSKTVFLVIDEDGDVKVFTGIRNVPQILSTGDTVANAVLSGDYVKYIFVDLQNGEMGSSDLSDDIIFLLAMEKQGNDADDDEYYRYKVLKNGDETKVRIEKEVISDKTGVGYLLMDIEYTGKNYITDATEVKGAVAADRDDVSRDEIAGNYVAQDGNTLELGTQAHNDYFMAEKYTIFVIDGAEWETYTMKQLERAMGKGLSVDGAVLYGILNDDAEYTALYIVL